MRALILIVIFFASILYFNFSYARIYNFIKEHKLPDPNLEHQYVIKSDQTLVTGELLPTNIRYVALGDSLTTGVGSSSFEKTYPYILAKKLTNSASEVFLVNLGTPGAKTVDVLKVQLPQALALNPNYVSLLIGANDVHGLISRDSFRSSYGEIVETLKQQTKARILLINIPYLGSDELIWPPHKFWINFRTRQLNEDIAQIAQQYNLKVIDLYGHLKSQSLGQGYYSADLFHPSAEGYILWGQLIDAD